MIIQIFNELLIYDLLLIQLSQAPLALKIKGDKRRQKEIKDIGFAAETGQTEYCPLSSAAEKRPSSFMFFASKALRDDQYLLNIRNFNY